MRYRYLLGVKWSQVQILSARHRSEAFSARRNAQISALTPVVTPIRVSCAAMGTRTANGIGNIRKRPNGTWEMRLSYLDGDGTLKRVSVYGQDSARGTRQGESRS